MSLQPKRYSKLVCVICGQDFKTLDEFSGHADGRGDPCDGGTPT